MSADGFLYQLARCSRLTGSAQTPQLVSQYPAHMELLAYTRTCLLPLPHFAELLNLLSQKYRTIRIFLQKTVYVSKPSSGVSSMEVSFVVSSSTPYISYSL